MKNSNMFSDYMVASSVNRSIRSINNSPTTGIVHKQRSSYGPRLTLVNRSNENSPSKQEQKLQSQGYIQKILLLSLEISRLNNINELLKKQSGNEMYSSKINGSKQYVLLKQSNQSLKIAIKTLQSSLMKSQQEKNKMKLSYQSRVNELQLELKNKEWKVLQNEKLLQKIRKQKYQLQIQIQRLSIQKSKQQFTKSKSMDFKLSKMQNQKNYQIQLLKQNQHKLQNIISELRFQIKFIQEQNEKIKYENEIMSKKETQLLMINRQYQNEFQQIKRRINYQLKQTAINTTMNMNQINKYDSTSTQYKILKQQNLKLQKQNIKLQKQNKQLQNQINQINIYIHQKQNSISQLKQNNHDLRNKYQSQRFKFQQQKNKYQQLYQRFNQLSAQYTSINNQYNSISNQFNQLSNQFNQKQFYQKKKTIKLQQDYKLLIKQKSIQVQNLQQQLQKLILQNGLLKKIINQQKQTLQLKNIEHSTKNIQLNDKLRKTQRKLRNAQRLTTTKKDIQNIYLLNNNHLAYSPQTRLFKSRSIESTSFFTNKKGIDLSLQSIVTTTVALQGSNERSLRLINKSQQKLISSCMSPIKNKRKVFIEMNGVKSRDSSVISSSQVQKKTKHKYKRSNRKQDQNMKSSIHQYYGDIHS